MLEINLESLADVERLLKATVETDDDVARRKHAVKSYEISEGKQREHVLNRLQRLFPKSYKSMAISDKSILKKVEDKLSKSYKESPLRKLENDQETEEYGNLVERSKFNEAMAEADRIFNRLKYCLVWVKKEEEDEEGERFSIVPLDGYEYSVLLDRNTGDLLAVIFLFEDVDHIGSKRVSEYAIWTSSQHILVRKTEDEENPGDNLLELLDIPNNEAGVNPLGRLPFYLLKKNHGPGLPIDNPLPDQSTEFNVNWSQLLSVSSEQIGQLVIKTTAEKKPETLYQGRRTALWLELSEEADISDASAEYIAPGSAIGEMRATFWEDLKLILEEHGITGAQAIGTNSTFSSGLERLIASADVQDIIEKNQVKFSEAENALFDIIKAYFANENKTPFNSKKVSVIFRKPRVLTSDKETREVIKQDLELGLIEEWEKFKRIDPNLTEEECKRKLERINKENEEKARKVLETSFRDNEDQDDFINENDEGVENGSANPVN